MTALATLSLIAAFLTPGAAPQKQPPDWHTWQFLLGRWTAEGGGPEKGSGSFSFHLELDGKVLVRDNRADYPATRDHPAYAHRDLMVIYPESAGRQSFHAIYFDNEGHVIQYTAESTPNGVVLISAASSSAPRYRLSYTRREGGAVKIRFEIAAPGHPDSFSTYLEGVARREKP